MIILVPFIPFLFLFLMGRTSDPSPGFLMSKRESGRYECGPASREALDRDRPGALREVGPRGSYMEIEDFRCRTPVFAAGERDARIDAQLDGLTPQVAQIVTAAEGLAPGATRWAALTQHDDHAVAQKIRFALEVELRSREKRVESELPEIPAASLVALSQLPPQQGYKDLCTRLPAEGKAWLVALSVDRKETLLHAGVCFENAWTWLL